jgi:nitrogen fixation protein NifU and related proteins
MDLYSEIILDYFKHPQNKGQIDEPTCEATEHNPTCGDKITIYLKTDDSGKITEVKYDGEGCAISQAATSMLTEKLLGRQLAEITKIDNDEIYEMLGVQISPGRVKCALLGLVCAKKAVLKEKYDQNR